jgi:enoyl-CoA hydratase/carnithine racemase
MLSPNEAKSLGIVNEICAKESLVGIGEERINQLLSVPDYGRILTKTILREDFSRIWEEFGKEEARMAWNALTNPALVKVLGKTIEQLANKSSL